MPSTLLQLRRRAGYRSAQDYAEHMGIPMSTYGRYESNPGRIPLERAWAIADDLGCPIDAVVGRVELAQADDQRGEVQRAYDALTPDRRSTVAALIRTLAQEQAREETDRESYARSLYDRLAAHYEAAMLTERMGDEKFSEAWAFGTPAERRAEMRGFLEGRAAEKRRHQEGDEAGNAARDEETIEQLMQAYDRRHGEQR